MVFRATRLEMVPSLRALTMRIFGPASQFALMRIPGALRYVSCSPNCGCSAAVVAPTTGTSLRSQTRGAHLENDATATREPANLG